MTTDEEIVCHVYVFVYGCMYVCMYAYVYDLIISQANAMIYYGDVIILRERTRSYIRGGGGSL